MAQKSTSTAPVTTRALLQRINRQLAKEGKQLKTMRGERWRSELGNYYEVDLNYSSITAKHVNPEEWGRELGVLQPWERVEA